MMKKLILLLLPLAFISCFRLPGEANTVFIVKNTSDKPITFAAGLIKCSQAFGCQEYKNSFIVNANDSIIARQIYFKKDSETPQNWFSSFEILPDENISFNDPKLPENWKKYYTDKTQNFTFTLNKPN